MPSFGNNPARELYRNLDVEAGTSEFDKIKATRGIMSSSQGSIARKTMGIGKDIKPSNKARLEMDVSQPSVRVAKHMSILKRKRAEIVQARQAEQAAIEAKKDTKEEESTTNGRV